MRSYHPLALLLAACGPTPAATQPPAPAAAPAVADGTVLGREELIPGELSVEVTAETVETRLGKLPGWRYVTTGNATFALPEVEALILRPNQRGANEYPREFLSPLARYVQLLRGRAPLLPGMAAMVAEEEPPLLAGTELRVFTFVRFDESTKTPRPEGRLSLQFMTHDEYTTAMTLGQVRVLARLGHSGEIFPTTPWIDPSRPPVIAKPELKQSMLASIPSRYLVGTSVVQHARTGARTQLSLEIGTEAAEGFKQLAAQPTSSNGFAVLTGLTPRADAYFVWFPGQTELQAIAHGDHGGNNIGGNFLAVMPSPKAEDTIRYVEDGFAVALAPTSWARLLTAIRDGTPYEVALKDITFTLTWPS